MELLKILTLCSFFAWLYYISIFQTQYGIRICLFVLTMYLFTFYLYLYVLFYMSMDPIVYFFTFIQSFSLSQFKYVYYFRIPLVTTYRYCIYLEVSYNLNMYIPLFMCQIIQKYVILNINTMYKLRYYLFIMYSSYKRIYLVIYLCVCMIRLI